MTGRLTLGERLAAATAAVRISLGPVESRRRALRSELRLIAKVRADCRRKGRPHLVADCDHIIDELLDNLNRLDPE